MDGKARLGGEEEEEEALGKWGIGGVEEEDDNNMGVEARYVDAEEEDEDDPMGGVEAWWRGSVNRNA